eukprot:36733-Amphidinium_carterae.1
MSAMLSWPLRYRNSMRLVVTNLCNQSVAHSMCLTRPAPLRWAIPDAAVASPCNLTPLDTPMSNAMLEHPIATAVALVRA